MKIILIVLVTLMLCLGFGALVGLVLAPFVGKVGVILISAVGGGFLGYLAAKAMFKYE